MKFFLIVLTLFILIVGGLALWTRFQVVELEKRFPPIGEVLSVDGRDIHLVDLPQLSDDPLPPLLFIHGASGNLRDQMGAYREKLEGRARLLFVDRPGHGYSQRGLERDNSPAGHAAVYSALLEERNIEKAILVCHSLGCASAAAMAVNHPEKVAGLVFVAPATHPWPGGVTWYYELAATPLIGPFMSETVFLPIGRLLMKNGVHSVFSPNDVPANYAERSALELVFRPRIFRANARDVTSLKRYVEEISPRYKEIEVPTVIITGDSDDIVLAEIHSVGLEKDIDGAELIVLEKVGHKPDYAETDVVISAIEKVAKEGR